MNPGNFRYKVAIVVPDNTQDSDFGNVGTGGGTTYNRFCDVIALKQAGAAEENAALQFYNNMKFVFRYESFFKDINESGQIRYDSQTFKINSVTFRGVGNISYVEIIAEGFE